jgi:hypothetical protein
MANGILQVCTLDNRLFLFIELNDFVLTTQNRAATSLLPTDNFVSPDFPHSLVHDAEDDKDAYLDFYINNDLMWYRNIT